MLFPVLFAAGTGTVTGCGGNAIHDAAAPTKNGTTGRATFTIRWPETSRLIPFAANSIKITVSREGALVGEQLVTRPANGGAATAIFERVPLGPTLVRAVAYPNADGSGVSQAQADTSITVVAGQTTPVKLSLQSTINKIDVTPPVSALTVGQTASLIATPKNESGEVVLVAPSTLVWSSQAPTVANVDVSGQVTAVGVGTATIEVKETESGKTAALPLIVTSVPDPGSGDVVCNAATGHCYEVVTVPNQIRWEDAKVAAEGRRYQGRVGHLVTVTSAEETAFLVANFDIANGWLGGYQDSAAANYSEPNGGWCWITGEPWTYTNWLQGEPNNTNQGEDKLQFWTARPGQWNDIRTDDPFDMPRGYVVEYEP